MQQVSTFAGLQDEFLERVRTIGLYDLLDQSKRRVWQNDQESKLA